MLKVDALPKLQKIKVRKNANSHVIPAHPARVLFNGATRSGKTNLIVSMLTKDHFYKNYFDHVFIISPNLHRDDTFAHIEKLIEARKKKVKQGLKPTDTQFHTYEAYDAEEMASVMGELSEATDKLPPSKRPAVLFVLDDIIEDKYLLNSSFLSTLFTKGRHYNASVWFSTQSYKSTPRKIRLQLSDLVIFEPRNDGEQKMIYEEWSSGMSEKEFTSMMKLVYEKPFQFLVVRPGSDKKERFSKNFEYWIVPNARSTPVGPKDILKGLPDAKDREAAKKRKDTPFKDLTMEDIGGMRLLKGLQ